MTRPISYKPRNKLVKKTPAKSLLEIQSEERIRFDEGFMVLGKGYAKSLCCYYTRLNNNVLVVGPSGSGKTRGLIEELIVNMVGNAIISDPKGQLVRRYRRWLERKGYTVLVLNLIHPEQSNSINPLVYVYSDEDIRKLARYIIYADSRMQTNGSKDPYWEQQSEILISAAIGLVIESPRIPDEDKNLHTVSQIVGLFYADEELYGCPVSGLFEEVYKKALADKGNSFAYRQYIKINQVREAEKTMTCIISTALGQLEAFEGNAISKLLSGNDIDLHRLANEKTVVFVVASDTDRSLDGVANVFYGMAMNELCNYADSCEDGALPIPMRFVLDDFATNVTIMDFDNIISNIRSRRISATIVCQAESQLAGLYGTDKAEVVMENFDTTLYIGCNSLHQADIISKRANVPIDEIMSMPLKKAWLFIRGQSPAFIDMWDIDEYLQAEKIDLNEFVR